MSEQEKRSKQIEANELLACPFCGSKELEVRHALEGGRGTRVVKCWGCGAWGPYGSSNSELAKEEWNRRANSKD